MLFPAPDMPVIKIRDMEVSVPTNRAPGADVVTAAARGGSLGPVVDESWGPEGKRSCARASPRPPS